MDDSIPYSILHVKQKVYTGLKNNIYRDTDHIKDSDVVYTGLYRVFYVYLYTISSIYQEILQILS